MQHTFSLIPRHRSLIDSPNRYFMMNTTQCILCNACNIRKKQTQQSNKQTNNAVARKCNVCLQAFMLQNNCAWHCNNYGAAISLQQMHCNIYIVTIALKQLHWNNSTATIIPFKLMHISCTNRGNNICQSAPTS